MFDQIDEQRIYDSNWREQVGCEDFYVRGQELECRQDIPDVTVAMGTKDTPAMISLIPKIEYITQQEYLSSPGNWSMGGQISDELFAESWTKATKKKPFFYHIEEHIRESTGGQPIYGAGADFFKNKRILIKTKEPYFANQVQALPVGTCRNYKYYELCLSQKRYFKVKSYEHLKDCRDSVPWATMLLDVPAYVLSPHTNATARLINKRRLSLNKKGFKLRSKKYW